MTMDQIGDYMTAFILPIILALLASSPGLYSLFVQHRKDKESLRIQLEESKAGEPERDANAAKIMSETMHNVLEDLRNELQERDRQHELERKRLETQHKQEIESRERQSAEYTKSLEMRLKTISDRLDEALQGIQQLREQIEKEFNGIPVYPKVRSNE